MGLAILAIACAMDYATETALLELVDFYDLR